MRRLELQLESEFTQFRRIWVEYAHKGNFKVIITVFPVGHGPYDMYFGELQQLSDDGIRNILVKNLVVTN
jgi:hypothetical protein